MLHEKEVLLKLFFSGGKSRLSNQIYPHKKQTLLQHRYFFCKSSMWTSSVTWIRHGKADAWLTTSRHSGPQRAVCRSPRRSHLNISALAENTTWPARNLTTIVSQQMWQHCGNIAASVSLLITGVYCCGHGLNPKQTNMHCRRLYSMIPQPNNEGSLHIQTEEIKMLTMVDSDEKQTNFNSVLKLHILLADCMRAL